MERQINRGCGRELRRGEEWNGAATERLMLETDLAGCWKLKLVMMTLLFMDIIRMSRILLIYKY